MAKGEAKLTDVSATTVKIKVGILASEEFQKCFDALSSLDDVPTKTLFAIRGISKILREEVTKYGEVYDKLLDEHAKKNDKGERVMLNPVTVALKDPKAFNKKKVELFDLEAELPMIKYSALAEEGKKPKLKPIDLIQLDFITED